jgi:ABC-type sugar transport system ATPase subunit
MQLTISDIAKRFGSVEALRGASFQAEPGEFFALLGPSGAGKTTLLRIIAGIDQPDRGRVLLDGRDVADLPVRARDTAMVFQTFALYPHLSAFENLAYPLREARVGSDEIKRRVGEIAEMLRFSHALSKAEHIERRRAAALCDRPGVDTPAQAFASR